MPGSFLLQSSHLSHTVMTMDLLTPQEAADQMRVSLRAVHAWLASGKLKGVRLPGGMWRIEQREIDRVLMGGKQGGE